MCMSHYLKKDNIQLHTETLLELVHKLLQSNQNKLRMYIYLELYK